MKYFHASTTIKFGWINIGGLGNVEMLRQLGKHFGIHPLALEDMLSRFPLSWVKAL
jgi:Mg2+ and Co2+ transporter CorA